MKMPLFPQFVNLGCIEETDEKTQKLVQCNHHSWKGKPYFDDDSSHNRGEVPAHFDSNCITPYAGGKMAVFWQLKANSFHGTVHYTAEDKVCEIVYDEDFKEPINVQFWTRKYCDNLLSILKGNVRRFISNKRCTIKADDNIPDLFMSQGSSISTISLWWIYSKKKNISFC